MASLKELLLSDANRPAVIRDTEKLVEDEVAKKGGISGFAIKAGYQAVRSIKPGLITEAVDSLLDRFVDRLEPFKAQWEENGRTVSFESFLSARSHDVANALLAVTDERAQKSSGMVKKTYEKLRPQGEKNVESAVPGLGRLIQKYV
ncbi:MAG: hypothetical protein ACFB9M_06830 [Myxococcota bacterium]